MQKFIHITDTHFVPPGNLLYGLNPIDRLALCVGDVNKHHPDAADPRVNTLLARKPPRLVTVALANRAARAIWAIMVRGEIYRMPGLASAAT